MAEARDVIDEARTWIGTPFHHQARKKGAGVDCVGLILEPLRAFGIVDFDVRGYARHPQQDLLMRHLEERCDIVDVPRMGDILLFRVVRRLQHVGWATSESAVLHASEKYGVKEHHLHSMRRSLESVYRIRGLSWQQ